MKKTKYPLNCSQCLFGKMISCFKTDSCLTVYRYKCERDSNNELLLTRQMEKFLDYIPPTCPEFGDEVNE